MTKETKESILNLILEKKRNNINNLTKIADPGKFQLNYLELGHLDKLYNEISKEEVKS